MSQSYSIDELNSIENALIKCKILDRRKTKTDIPMEKAFVLSINKSISKSAKKYKGKYYYSFLLEHFKNQGFFDKKRSTREINIAVKFLEATNPKAMKYLRDALDGKIDWKKSKIKEITKGYLESFSLGSSTEDTEFDAEINKAILKALFAGEQHKAEEADLLLKLIAPQLRKSHGWLIFMDGKTRDVKNAK